MHQYKVYLKSKQNHFLSYNIIKRDLKVVIVRFSCRWKFNCF